MANPTIPVFDIGNVLLDWNPRYLYRKIFSDGERMEWFLTHVCTNAWNLEQDRGRSFPDAVKLLSAEHPDWAAEISAFDLRWPETVSGAIHDSVAVLEKLRRDCSKVYAITNFNDEKFALAQKHYPFLTVFDDIVVSATEKMLKPAPEIYHTLLHRNGVKAEECVFIDDSEKNVLGARAVGMHAIHFTSARQMADELRAFGFSV
ncbi:MAG: HAD family hydrolase [Beijerinckiaceae bacterium]